MPQFEQSLISRGETRKLYLTRRLVMGTGDTNSPFGRSIALAPPGQVVRRAIFGRGALSGGWGREEM